MAFSENFLENMYLINLDILRILIRFLSFTNIKVNDKNLLKTFLKEASEEKPLITDKLTLKRRDLEGKDGDVIVLEVSK